MAGGGAGGAVLLDATAGGITLGGSMTTTGGNGFGGGAGGNAGAITVSDAATLTANVILSAVGGTGGTTGAGGPIQLLGTVDGNVAGTRSLALAAGTSNVMVGGAIGGTNSLLSLTATGNAITTNSINTTGALNAVGGAVSSTATGALTTTSITTVGGTTTGGVGVAARSRSLAVTSRWRATSRRRAAMRWPESGRRGDGESQCHRRHTSIGLSGNITAQGGTGVAGRGTLVGASHSTIRPRLARRHDLELRRHGHVHRCGWGRGVYGGGPRHDRFGCHPRSLTSMPGLPQRLWAPRWAAGRTGQCGGDRRHDESDHQRDHRRRGGQQHQHHGQRMLNSNVTFTTDRAARTAPWRSPGRSMPMLPPIVSD